MPATAIQHVRRMRGGAQSHLMRADDGNFYVVKFRNNPQHLRVLANEMLATRLAEMIALPVPPADIVDVSDWLISNSPELRIELAGRTMPVSAGCNFGSRYAADPADGQVVDYIPEAMFARVRNMEAFAGVLALDKWLCNSNGRQAVFCKRARERKYSVSFIDHGYCFNAGEWTFPDSPLRGVYPWNRVYAGVTGWESFEPWLSRIEGASESAIWSCAEAVPPEWYGEWDDMERLVSTLIARRSRVRELIAAFKDSRRQPFVNWGIGESRQGTGDREQGIAWDAQLRYVN